MTEPAPNDSAPPETVTPSITASISALVVDDEPLARVNLRALLDGRPGWRVVGEAGSGSAAAAQIEEHRPDVVFLDIRMPGQSGLELARLLDRARPRPLVVFATAFEEHALEAFEVEAVDYLIKPFDQARFLETVGRLERRMALVRAPGAPSPDTSAPETSSPDTLAPDPSPVHAPARPQTLAVRSVGRVRLVDVDEIHWIGAAGNYVRLYLAHACYLHRATLASLEKSLDPARFLRIHRSTLVQRQQVVELRTSVSGRYRVLLRDGTELEIAQRLEQRVLAELVPGRRT